MPMIAFFRHRLVRSFVRTVVMAGALLAPSIASAHQPRIVSADTTVVGDPEISKAFYGQLKGEPQIFTISSTGEFAFYVNILVPDVAGQSKDVVATVSHGSSRQSPIVELRAGEHAWTHYFEGFGRSWYWQGPEYRRVMPKGAYTVTVSNPGNNAKYVLAIGEKESFDFKEGMNALYLTPKLKRDFFLESPAGFLFSPFGYGYVIAMFALAVLFGAVYRVLIRKIAKGGPQGLSKNIGKKDRWSRALLGIALFVLAITTTWSPFPLFFSGFCLFEAAFSWCGVYAAMGKTTCPRP